MSLLYERRSRKSRFRTRSLSVLALQFFWVVLVIWCEFGVFFYSLADCRWPDQVLGPQSGTKTKPTRALLVADAQVPNPATTSRYDRITTYLRKSWAVASRLRPDVVIFLGDTLSSGRHVTSKQEYDAYYHRFQSIFRRDEGVSFYFIPGNTDVGLGSSLAVSVDAPQHFTEYFGPLNQAVTIAGHTLVLIDAPRLVEEDYHRHAHDKTYEEWTPLSGGPIAFLQSISASQPSESIILLSHIPLSRPTAKSCGPLREKGFIRAGAGHGYQNMLGRQTTEFILKTLQPSAIFSGDNRDYCEVRHEIPNTDGTGSKREAREVTVKSFSPSRHIRWPGFQLVSLFPPEGSSTGPTISDMPCHLPDTLGILHSLYVPSVVLTAVVLLYVNIAVGHHHRRISSISLTSRGRPPRPESAVWSTWSPRRQKAPTSPTTPLPPNLRISSSKGVPSYRVTPLSRTPQGTPLLSPIALFPTEDMEDPLSPTPYLTRRDHPNERSGAWMMEQEHEEEHRNSPPAFLPPPRTSPTSRPKSWTWTRSFEFMGRRRRVTCGIPWWGSTGDGLIRACWFKRRGLLWALTRDAISVALPAVIAQIIIGWFFYN